MRLAVAAIAMALLAGAAPAPAATPQTELPDIEDEVMCPICGTLLELAQSPQAERERAYISGLIAEGRTKSEIEDELVAQYGDRVLALPGDSGFNLSAYLVPAIAFLAAAVALAISVWRWRGGPRPPGSDGEGPPDVPTDEESERLEADLARYDL